MTSGDSSSESGAENQLGGHADDCSNEPNEWIKPYRLSDYTLVWVCDECDRAMLEEHTDR